MAKGRGASERKKQKQLNQRRRRKKRQNQTVTPLAKQLTRKLAGQVDDACDLVDAGKFAEAEQLLDRLNRRYNGYPAIVEAQIYLYQTTENHELCCQAAEGLTKLTPRDGEARLMYAQESMLCGRFGIALANYRLFLQRWPDHADAEKAKNAIELIEPECEAKIADMGFAETGLELLVMHDEALESIQNGAFDRAAMRCSELLKVAPDCAPARNNLALAYFQSGKVEQAVQVAEQTCHRTPQNRFAEAMLGKLRFLSGREDEANEIADQIVVNPPTEQDPLAAAIELLSFLGRDEDIVVLSERANHRELMDPRCEAIVLHHLAVAQYRLGDEKAARSSWKKCLQAMPTHPDARENLDDLNSGTGHAPWADMLAKWIPRAICDNMFNNRSALSATGHLNLAKDCPAVAALIPALLDRGDPLGREMAMRMAVADGSPAMLDTLHQFALSSRGPDAMRHEALNVLLRESRVDSGPHRFYSRGKWTEIKLFTAEIHWEATECDTPWVQELVETGIEALKNDDFTLAEESFDRVLDDEPDNCSAAYNLCVVWLQRDGRAGRRRAQARIEEIHEQYPDYLFAPISLAQFAAMDGDLDRASKLLEPVLTAKRLHGSEAIALFTTQVQIAIKRREFDSAEQSWELLVELAGEDDPKVAALRSRIDNAADRRGLRRLLPWG